MRETNILIEKAKPDDVQEMLLVINKANREAFVGIIPKEHFREPIITHEQFNECSERMTFYVHRQKGVVVAVAALGAEDQDCGRIRWVYVLREYQRQGIGTALVLHLEREARGMGLSRARLVTDNDATWAIAFYERLGYTLTRRVPNPWGFDSWMEKPLSRLGRE
ncbi:MAG: GNAT family N-acetyltransferase [Candidatus Thorarchaeota archaeon]|nr:MAG: GNAT family N-acetyltransferase [Candidatus Thorarchaeota archaeon]